MGSSYWSNDFYKEREEVRAKTGKSAFEYNDKVAKAAPKDQKVHEKLNPHKVVRESRDSTAHPESLAIMVFFDVTGSMGTIPIALQKKLPTLMNTLNARKYVKDPQVFFGAVGDAISDRGSLQVGQFESGIETDDDLGRMWLEKGGGGSMQESYQNAVYFAARHTSCDCFEKRAKKGYLFLIGDEMAYDHVNPAEIKRLIGDDLQETLSTADIIKEAQARWHVFFIIPQGASYSNDPRLLNYWTKLVGSENILRLDNNDGVCETITMAIGLCEGTVNLDTAKDDMRTAGSNATLVNAAAAALNNLAKSKGGGSRTARL